MIKNNASTQSNDSSNSISNSENMDYDNLNDDKYAKRHIQIKQGVSIVGMLTCSSTLILVFFWSFGDYYSYRLLQLLRDPAYSTSGIRTRMTSIPIKTVLQRTQLINGTMKFLRRPRKHIDILEDPLLQRKEEDEEILRSMHSKQFRWIPDPIKDGSISNAFSKSTQNVVGDDGHVQQKDHMRNAKDNGEIEQGKEA